MEAHIYSAKAKSQVGNFWVKYMTAQNDQNRKKVI